MPRNNQLQQERCQRHQGLSSDGEDREGTDAFNSPAAAFQHWSSQLRRRSPLLSTDKMSSTEENGDSDGENRDISTKKTSMDESSGSNGIVAARKVDFSPRLRSHRSSTNKSASFPSKKDLNVFSVSRKDPAMTCSGPNHPKSSPVSSKMTDNSPARRRRAVHGLRPPSTPHTPRSPQPSRPTSVVQSWTTHQPDPDFWPANESMDVLLAKASVDSSGIHKAQSQDLPLHSTITQATCIHELWNATVRDIVTVDSAASQNDEGQTPIHLFAENAALADQLILYHNPTAAQTPPDADDMLHVTRSGLDSDAPQSDDPTTSLAAVERQLVHFGLHLLHAYPAAMMTPDGDGFIPFERTLSEWIDQVHREPTCNPRKPQRNQFQSATDLLPTQITSFLASSTTRWASQPKKSLDLSYKIRDETSSDGSLDVESGVTTKVLPKLATGSKTQEKTLHNRSRQFPDKVQLTAQAQFAFLMLSSFLDHLDRRLEETTFLKTRRSSLATSTRPLTGTPSALPDVGALGAEDSFHEAMDELRHMTVADIRSEIVRSIASIPDLVKTLLIMENDTQRSFCFSTALMHHVLASKYSVGPWLPGMLQHSEERISDLAVGYLKLVSERDIEDGIPRMQWGTSVRAFRNSGGKVERHGKMDLHDEVSRLEDFVPSLLSLGERQMEEAATTKLVRKVMDCIISRPFAVTVVFCDALFLAILLVGFRGAVNSLLLGGVSSTVTRHLYLANAGIFYFVVRELGKVVSLCMITRRARVYFQSFWNLADLLSTVLALTSTIAMRAALGPTETNMAGATNLRNLLAITTGFLWLRVLNYLKGINMQLATFVLAILQITRDILWFCVILLTLIVSFAQMFFTLLAPDTCVAGDILSNKKECTQSEYYLKVYAILLGDFGTFERESFTSMFSVFLVVFYSFMVVLILLNILIAVASDSYEKCLIRSQSLFGRARVMMIAELVSFQNLLRKNPHVLLDSSSTGPTAPIFRTWLSGNSWANGWSRGSMTFFLLSSTVVLVWGIAETAGYATGNRNVNVWMSISSIAINVALFVGIVIFLSTGGTEIGPTQLEGYLQFVMLRLLGSTKDTTNTVTGSDHDGWQGRLVYIKTEIKRLSDEAKSETAASTKSLVNLIGTTEGRLQDELSRVEIGLNELKQLLQPGQLPTYQPNEKKTTIANIHNTMKDLVETLHRMETAEEVKGEQS